VVCITYETFTSLIKLLLLFRKEHLVLERQNLDNKAIDLLVVLFYSLKNFIFVGESRKLKLVGICRLRFSSRWVYLCNC